MNPFASIESFFKRPRFEDSQVCREHSAWVRAYQAESIEAAEIALEQGRRQYAEFCEAFATMDAKAGELIKVAGLITTGLFAAVAGWDLTMGPAVRTTFGLLLLSIAISLWARSPFARSSQPTARSILEAGGQLDARQAQSWVAASLHETAEQLRVAVDWKAGRVRQSTWVLCGALAALVLAAWTR